MRQLIRKLEEANLLDDTLIAEAFDRIDRKDFVPPEYREHAEEDRPLPIGAGQTISQPYVVAFMLNLLNAQPGDKVMDAGSGSGWQTALLSRIVGPRGLVVAVERLPELFEIGKSNCERYGLENVEFIRGDATQMLKAEGFFDRIIVAAASETGVPEALKRELREGGRMVIPVGESIRVLDKIDENDFTVSEYPGFAFVPLIPSNEQL